MLQEHTAANIVFQRYFRPMTFATALLVIGNAAWADSNQSGTFKREVKNDRAVRLLETVRIPPVLPAANKTAGALYSFDISWVDQASRTYYLADRSNAAIDIVDTTSDILLAQLTPAPLAPFAGFTGSNATSG